MAAYHWRYAATNGTLLNEKAGNVTGLAISNATHLQPAICMAGCCQHNNYKAAYKQSSSILWISLSNLGTALSYNLAGLAAGDYDFRIRASNTAGCKSNWNQLQNKTIDQFNEPENPSEVNITSTAQNCRGWRQRRNAEIPLKLYGQW